MRLKVQILTLAENGDYTFAEVGSLGKITPKSFLHEHIQSILSLDLVDVKAIKEANFRVAIDCVNSVGGIAVPELLYALGVKKYSSFIVRHMAISLIIPNHFHNTSPSCPH